MKSIFFGEIREDLIFPFPSADQETAESVEMILDTLYRFGTDRVRSAEWDDASAIPKEIVSELAELGLMGLAVPEELGGLGLPQLGYGRVMQAIGQIDASLGVTLGAHQSIGYKAVLLFGTDEQKKRFLPRLASGELIACYCLTEPGSGSDAASIKTKAVRSADGKFWEITGNKLWITNGGIASFMTVFAKTEVDGKEKVSCFAVELPTDGISVGPEEKKLGIKGSWTNAIHFDRVKVPHENLIGGEGYGFRVAMGVLNHGRMGLGSGCVGKLRDCIKSSVKHVTEREQFNKKIGDFGLVQEKIAQMMIDTYVAESMVVTTASFVDRQGIDYSLESAITKIFATEAAWRGVDETVQIHGGNGYMKEFPFEQWLRDTRINRIFEGTNEILRAFVALAGMQGPGQELAGLAEAIKYPLKGLGPVTDFAKRKIKQSVVGQSVGRSHPALKRVAGVLEERTVEFARQVETLLRRYGKKVHLRQIAQHRIADMAIDLFALSCTLSRVTRRLEEVSTESECELELRMIQTFSRHANRRIAGHIKRMDKNEDEEIVAIAKSTYEKGQYPFDAFLWKA